MSYDRQIDQVCPHLIVEEALYVDSSRRVVRPLRPISSAQSVRVRLNQALEVPSYGAHVSATGLGLRQGPYSTNNGDTLIVQVDGGVAQVVTLHAAFKMPTDRLAYLLSASLTGVTFTVELNRIRFQAASFGRASTVMFKPSVLASTLGFAVNHEFRGCQVAPGWTLVSDPNTLSDRPTRLVVFDEPLKSVNDVAELDYTTVRQECRRCGGIGVEHDWIYGATGEIAQVRDEALLIQELQKLTYTVRGSNPFHSWYGTTIIEAIGKKMVGNIMQNLIVSDIHTAFSRWQSIKRQQEGTVGQLVSDEEFPFRLMGVQLQQSTKDPSVVYVNVSVQNRALKQLSLERGLKLPEPIDLLGSTQQQGIIRQSLKNWVQSD